MHLFQSLWAVDDDTDSEEVIDAFEGTLLFLHLLPYTVDALRAPFDMTVDTSGLHLLLYRFDKPIYIRVACCLCGAEFLTDMIIGIVLHILQREVFEFTLQVVESELMCQRSIEVCSFLRHLLTGFLVFCITNAAHQVHPVGNHNEDHAHILSKRQ